MGNPTNAPHLGKTRLAITKKPQDLSNTFTIQAASSGTSKPSGVGFGNAGNKSVVQGAGKKLNKNYAATIKSAMNAFAELQSSFEQMLKDAGELEDVAASSSEPAADGDLTPRSMIDPTRMPSQSNSSRVMAGEFADRVARTSWYERFYSTMNVFGYMFEECLWNYSDLPAEDVQAKLEEMVGEFGVLMMNLADIYNETFVSASSKAVQAAEIQAQAAHGETEKVENLVQLNLGEISLASASSGNSIPISGVLATLDKPSEGVPEVGPGMPLFISSEVAAQALHNCTGLPLDAHESLRQHANESIVGVILSGSVKNNEMHIQGHLYPFNQPSKVAAIRANQRHLGMSMNASAPGHVEEIEGQQVYVVDELILLGANILEAEAATYKNTKIAAKTATGSTSEPTVPVAAAAQTTPDTGDQTDMNEQQVAAVVAKVLEPVTQQLAQLSENVNTLTTERNERIAAEEKQAAEVQAQADRDALSATIRKELTQLVNPSGVPSRITQPTAVQAAATSDASPEATALQTELNRLEGQMEVFVQAGNSGGMMEKRIAAANRIREIKALLGQSIAALV